MTDSEREAVRKLRRELERRFQIRQFLVFGSKARGDDSPDSDIDVMIEIEEYSSEVVKEIDDVVFEINLAHGCLISTVVFSREELEEGPLGESPLYKRIRAEGLAP